MDISIRNLDKATVLKLGQLAQKKKMSREAYCRMVLETAALTPDFLRMENKYEDLVKRVLYVVEENTEILKEIRLELKKDQEGGAVL